MPPVIPSRVRWAKTAILFAVYFGAAKLGLSFDALGGVASTVWPPTGIALGALLLHGTALWPAVALGAFLANLGAGMPLLTAAIMGVGNTLEAVVGTALLRRLNFRPALDRLRDAFLLVAVGALLSTTISATFGVLGLWLGGVKVAHELRAIWGVWWMGDVMGALLIGSLLLTWSVRPGPRTRAGALEAAILSALLGAATVVVFAGFLPPWYTELFRQSHVVFPLLIWMAFRFGQRGATASLFVVSALAISCTVLGLGPFVRGTRHEGLLLLQSYMLVEVVTVLTLGAAITERRRAVMARDEFISIASHELKTPITALKLRLDLFTRLLYQATVPRPLRDNLEKGLTRADVQVNRLTRLVDDLLDVSRLTGGRLELTFESVRLADVVRDVLERVGDDLAEAGCNVQLQLEPEIAGHWDRVRVEQVLTNLLTNVIRYAPGAPVTIAAAVFEGQARLTVQDRGPGIPRAQQNRIFEAFERGTSRQVGGLGLGLFIVRQIVNAHGGNIVLESDAGQGATFRVWLPCEERRAPPARLEASAVSTTALSHEP